MREYIATAFNFMGALDPDDGEFRVMAEMIVISSEAKWVADAAGYHPARTLVEHRTFITAAGLRSVAAALLKQADTLDRLQGVEVDFSARVKGDAA